MPETHDQIAERIIRNEVLAFTLVCVTGKETDATRAMLKAAIVKALYDQQLLHSPLSSDFEPRG